MQNKVSFNSNLAKYGKGLFETIKVVNGEAVFLTKHLKRLYDSIQALNIDFNLSRVILREKIIDFVSDLEEKALRVTVCDEGYNLSTRDIPYTESDYKEGYDLMISDIKRGNNPLYRHKTTNYFTNLYAKKKAQNEGCDDILFLNTDNFVLESTAANIFFIKGQKIYTPAIKLPLLPGVIRDEVLTIAKELDFETKELMLERPELALFDCAFLTNSLVGLIKVNGIGSIKYHTENNIFNRLKAVLKNKELRG